MIDLHCHILPGIDDGARNMDVSLKMARIAHEDGITVIVCTPHITPGIFDNDAWRIYDALQELQAALDEEGIPIQLYMGADIHVSPDMPGRLSDGAWPSIAGTRYFLFEPPHHVLPPNILSLARKLLDMGLVPMLTHPERLTWIEKHYDVITALDEAGAVVQITAGAITGRFGDRPRYWSERLLEEGRVDIIATDAHSVRGRPPLLAEGRDAAARIVGEKAAWDMVETTPLAMLRNETLPKKRRKVMRSEGVRPRKNKKKASSGLFGWLKKG